MEGAKKKKSKSSSSPGEGRVDAEEKDMISALPDCSIHHILSFLTMEDVRRTSMLSKRWRYLWTSLPVLDFYVWKPRFVDRCLMLYEGPKIRRFRVDIYHEIRASRIDSWIRFAMRRDVEELDLSFTEVLEDPSTYMLPPSLFDCRALRVLKLQYCVLDLPAASFCFCWLTDLHLDHVQLTDLDTSGCPVLQNLKIAECKSLANIYAPNQKLRYLEIEGYDKDPGLTLYAPYLQFLEYYGDLRCFYNFVNLSSITSATLGICNVYNYESDSQMLVELLKLLGHAKTLKLSHLSLKLLSYREDKLKAPPLSATCLETNWKESELSGLTFLLSSSHSLESLIINIDSDPEYQRLLHTFDEVISWELLELTLPADLQLKTVTLHNFMGCEVERESYPNMDNFLGNSKEIRLVKLFLKRCKMLDKVIINTIKKPDLPPKLMLCLTKKLLVLPRASPKAEIHFT